MKEDDDGGRAEAVVAQSCLQKERLETQGRGAGGCGISTATSHGIKALEAKTSDKRVVIQLSLLKKNPTKQ